MTQDMTGQVLTNWAGTVTFTPRRSHRPASVEELARVVAGAENIRAVGTVHSFNRIADCAGDLVSLDALPRTVRIDPDRTDPDRATVRVSAGTRYGELAPALHEAGYALANLASLPHISIAGAVATGTHGSGERVGNLATAVSAIEILTASGEIVTLHRNDDTFRGAVVALGALGIVTHLTLDVVPTFEVAQDVYEDVPRDEAVGALGSAYSVSLFTDWTSTRINQVWRKRRIGSDEVDWVGGTRAERPRHPVPGMSPVHCTEQLGAPGPWYARLPHFRMEFTPSAGEEVQSEYLIARDRLIDALSALDGIRDRIAPLLLISEIRTVAADDLWLSPSYRRDSAAIHFTWVRDVPAVTALLPDIEERLAPMDARPHWGKLFTTAPDVIRERYERMPDFVRLRAGMDPDRKFGNPFVDRYVGGI